MRILCALALSLLAGCSSCNKPSTTRDAGARRDAGPADAGFDAAGPLGLNEGFVKRYEDEEAVESVTKTVAAAKAIVLTAHPHGETVETLGSGKNVVALAEHDGFFLVTFEASDARKLTGWVVKFAFEEPVDAGAPGTRLTTLRCVGQKLLVVQDGKPRCDYVCYRDLECREGATCEAVIELPKSGVLETETRYTTVCSGGTPEKKDSGVPSLFGEARQPDGTCRPGTTSALSLGPLCFQSCKVDRDCPPESSCRSVAGSPDKLCHAD